MAQRPCVPVQQRMWDLSDVVQGMKREDNLGAEPICLLNQETSYSASCKHLDIRSALFFRLSIWIAVHVRLSMEVLSPYQDTLTVELSTQHQAVISCQSKIQIRDEHSMRIDTDTNPRLEREQKMWVYMRDLLQLAFRRKLRFRLWDL